MSRGKTGGEGVRLLRIIGVGVVVTALATLLWAQAAAQATFRFPSGEGAVTAVDQGAETFLAVDEVFSLLGGTLSTEPQGFRVSLGTTDAVFGTDSRFAVVKDDIIEMPQAPIVIEERAFVPWQFLQGFLKLAADYEVSWDPASRVLTARPTPHEAVSAQVSVVNLENITKIVIQLSGRAEYSISRSGTTYSIALRNPVRPPFPEQIYADPLLSRIAFRDRQILIQMRQQNVVGDAYQLQNPFRIVLDLREGVAPQEQQPLTPSSRPMRPLKQRGVRTIVLDPGHGGREVGAIGANGLQEKDATLAICRKLSAILASRLGVRVVLTRNDDTVVPLDQRTALANQYKADLFLSVHLNASLIRTAQGSSTYFLSVDASDDLARKVAERENASPTGSARGSGDDLQLILWDLAQQEYLKESSRFAEIVQEEMDQELGNGARGVKQAPFKVLVGATMPAALVEVGFISNPTEEARLSTEEYQTKIATSLSRAIERFKGEYEVRLGVARPPLAAQPPTEEQVPPAAVSTGEKKPGR